MTTKQPFNLESEKAVIGALLIKPDLIFDVQQYIESTDFYASKYRNIYDAIAFLAENRKGIDQVSVADELRRRKQLKDCGGIEHLHVLYVTVPKEHNAIYYAQIIERTAFLRRLSNAALQINLIANADDTETIDEKRQQAESLIMEACKRVDHKDLQPLKNALSEVYDDVDTKSKQDIIPGVMTGFRGIDNLLGGLQNSDLIYVAGRPGMGKSSLMLCIGLNTSKLYQKTVAIFTLEMSDIQVARRLIAMESGIDSKRLRIGKLKENEWPLFIQHTGALSNHRIWIDDSPIVTINKLRAKLRRLQMKTDIDLVIIDYIQLMQPDRKSNNRVTDFTDMSAGLKRLAREFDIPFLVGSQLSRAVEQRTEKRPMLSDLRESGGLEQDADQICFIYRDEYYNPETEQPNVAETDWAKNRNGPTAMVPLYFQKELAKFRDLEVFHKDLEF